MKIHTEQTFETAIIEHLCANGWTEGRNTDFDRALVFDPKTVLAFVQATQPKEWHKLVQFYKGETESQFIRRADEANYEAKRRGKNCVVAAPRRAALGRGGP